MSNLWLPLQNLQARFSSIKLPEPDCWIRLPCVSEMQLNGKGPGYRTGLAHQGWGYHSLPGALPSCKIPQYSGVLAVPPPSLLPSMMLVCLLCVKQPACLLTTLSVIKYFWTAFFHEGPKLLPMPPFSFLHWNVILWPQNDYFFL